MNHNKKKNRASQYWTDFSLYRCVILALIISGVILLLDINGLPTLWLEEYGRESVVTVIALAFVMFLVVMVKRHCLAWIKIPCQNIGDEMILSIMLCCLIIGSFELIFSSLYMYKLVLLALGLFISLILILVHYFLCRKREKSIEKSVDEKTDLIQLLEGKVKHSDLPITFAETASDLDLLGREGLVNVICDSIRSCSPDHVIKPRNLFRILSDMVRESVGTGGYGYWVKEKYIIDLFGEKESFQFMVEKAVPTNETEEFLLKLWNRMQNGEKDYWGEDDYHSPIPVNLEL